MVGNDGRPNNSGGLDNDVAVEVLFILKVESIGLPDESNVGCEGNQ